MIKEARYEQEIIYNNENEEKACKLLKIFEKRKIDLIDAFISLIKNDEDFVGYLIDNFGYLLDEEEF